MSDERVRIIGRRGGSLGVTIPTTVLRALDLRTGDRVEVRLRSKVIELAPIERSGAT